ncbi:unnamed protein product [Effrenium voratum]|nr:unnamed protein product [Effrenium voratum]
MQMCRGVLLVLDRDGTPFNRIWCCFEQSIAIEHREDGQLRHRLLLDVGATAAEDTAHVLTDGLAGAETRMIGIVGLHRKSVRERGFPFELLEEGLTVNIEEANATQPMDKVRILNSIAFPRLETCKLDQPVAPEKHDNFRLVDQALASHFALASWYNCIWLNKRTERLATALRTDVSRKLVQLSFTGCQHFSDPELESLVLNLPSELRVLRLDLGFTGLETLDCFASADLRFLVQLKLRFTGSPSLRNIAGLSAALQKWSLTHLELWFMNLPRLEQLGSLSTALLSLRLQELIFDLNGCPQISEDARIQLHEAIKGSSLRRSEAWVNIEGLSRETWLRSQTTLRTICALLLAQCPRVPIWRLRHRRNCRTNALAATRLGRSASDQSDTADTEDEPREEQADAARPFPCSHPGCTSFHGAEDGYCEKHRSLKVCKHMLGLLNTLRQYVELGLLILTQAVAEVESRWLLILIILSLCPVAAYSLEQSTGSSAAEISVVAVPLAVISIAYTTARLNQMQELTKELEVQAESVYAMHLGRDMSLLFGEGQDILQHVGSLKDHFLEARKRFDKFQQEVCLPLRDFLNDQGPATEGLKPMLRPVQAVRHRDLRRLLDLLYCHVTFDGLESMARAWQFLRARVQNEVGGVEVVSVRDSFAVLETGHRCAQIVVGIDGYFATVFFYEESLSELEKQLDDVHRLAKHLRLANLPTQIHDVAGLPLRSWPVGVAVGCLRAVSLLAAIYLGAQYFIRYCPAPFRATLAPSLKAGLALKEVDTDGQAEGWWLSIAFALPYLALTIVLILDLRRCGSTQHRKWKPTQVLYETYFGIEGKFYSIKVAGLQLLTVMLQALGKLQLLGGIVSFAAHARADADAFQSCFWVFVGLLCLNSIYPSMLLFFDWKWMRLGAAMMDAVLDIAYTLTYLVLTLLAISELSLDQQVAGNFGDEAAVNFEARLDPAFVFPVDCLGYVAVYYSVAHVCTVCRALERADLTPMHNFTSLSRVRSANLFGQRRWRATFKALYSPSLLLVMIFLLISSESYPSHPQSTCFPCRCIGLPNGTQQLESCGLIRVLRFKDVSLSDRNISSVAEKAFDSAGCLQRLSLSGNPLGGLPKVFASLTCLQLLDLGRTQLQSLEPDTFNGLSSLRILSLSQNQLEELPEELLQPIPLLKQLLLGGKSDASGSRLIMGNPLKSLPHKLLQHSPSLRVLDVSETDLTALPMFAKNPFLHTLDARQCRLRELPAATFAGLSMLQKLDLSSNSLSELPAGVLCRPQQAAETGSVIQLAE